MHSESRLHMGLGVQTAIAELALARHAELLHEMNRAHPAEDPSASPRRSFRLAYLLRNLAHRLAPRLAARLVL